MALKFWKFVANTIFFADIGDERSQLTLDWAAKFRFTKETNQWHWKLPKLFLSQLGWSKRDYRHGGASSRQNRSKKLKFSQIGNLQFIRTRSHKNLCVIFAMLKLDPSDWLKMAARLVRANLSAAKIPALGELHEKKGSGPDWCDLGSCLVEFGIV